MSFRQILSPLLIISYVCGSRIIEFRGVPRYWFGLLYMLLLWFLYNFVVIYVIIPRTIDYVILYHVWFGSNMFVAFLSIIIGIYYNKAFRNCIKNLTIVDDTLEKLGITTDYKLYMRTIWRILGFWFLIVILIIYLNAPLKSNTNDIVQAIFILFMQIYCIHINIITDLTITSMLGYVGLKFDQINEHLQKLTNDNKHRTKQNWGDSVLLFHQSRYTKAPENAYIIWIVIHLHSELRKISRKIDLIFGTQMTTEMGCYFAFIALNIEGVFDVIFTKDYGNGIHYVILLLVWFSLHIFRLFFINYECEIISIKANVTGNFLSKLSYSSYEDEIRENILQFLLMTQSPIKFCGLGLFQFGFKFLQSFTTSVATVLIILLQTYTDKYVHP